MVLKMTAICEIGVLDFVQVDKTDETDAQIRMPERTRCFYRLTGK